MIGAVDGSARAFLPIRLRHPSSLAETQLDAWIDTGFTGELVLPRPRVIALGIPVSSSVNAILADGSQVTVDTYTSFLDWFGNWQEVEIIANDGQFALLGVGLLLERELHINYRDKTLSII